MATRGAFEHVVGGGDLLGSEVAHADVADQSLVPESVERGERLLGIVGVDRPVDVQQVDVIETEAFEAGLRAGYHVVAGEVVHPHLGRHEHVLARDRRALDAASDDSLVVVYLGRVDVPVSHLHGGRDTVGVLDTHRSESRRLYRRFGPSVVHVCRFVAGRLVSADPPTGR